MPPRLVPLALSQATTLPPTGFVITLTHLPVVMAVTTSARFWKDWSTRRHLKMGVSAEFIIGFFVSLTYALCHLWFCSQPFFPRIHLTLPEKQWKALLHLCLQRRALVNISRITYEILAWSCSFTRRLAAHLYCTSKKLTWPKLHSLVISP